MKNNRPGFTLVELLVVITIIGILMGLLIPAVNSAREAARKNQCATQLKNLSLAAIQHENAKGELPGYLQVFGNYPAGGTDPSDPTATAPGAHVKLGTWVVALMPFLDAQPTYEVWTEDRYPIIKGGTGELSPTNEANGAGVGFHPNAAPNLAIMQCPSNPNSDGEFARNSYVTNNGMFALPTSATGGGSTLGTLVSFAQSMERANGTFNNKFNGPVSASVPAPTGPKVRLDDMKDGQGYTMLFSENVQALPWNRPGFFNATDLTAATVAYPPEARYTQGMIWFYEDPQGDSAPTGFPWSHGKPNTVSPKHKINGRGTAPNESVFVETMTAPVPGTNAWDLARPSSAHVDSVNIGMADGGTRSLTSSVDYRVYQALMTPRGKSSDVPWQEYVMDEDAI
tara:strand:- start:191 stop:1384 length:1194 start_codon:yes stop_codon:yes gene_type:complete